MNILINELKDRFCGCIMLFQMGEFLQAYGEDADIVSNICGIYCHDSGTATSTITLSHLTVHHQMRKLVKAGFKVAIASRNRPELNLN